MKKAIVVAICMASWSGTVCAQVFQDTPQSRMKSCMNDMQSHPNHKLKNLDDMRKHCDCMFEKMSKQEQRSLAHFEKKDPDAFNECARKAGLIRK
jgi:hypothetical protein